MKVKILALTLSCFVMSPVFAVKTSSFRTYSCPPPKAVPFDVDYTNKAQGGGVEFVSTNKKDTFTPKFKNATATGSVGGHLTIRCYYTFNDGDGAGAHYKMTTTKWKLNVPPSQCVIAGLNVKCEMYE